MKGLTAKEEEIMGFFWEKGPLFVKELLAFYSDPKPHFNTLSTIVRGLEEKGYLSHEAFGNTYRYFAIISNDEFRSRTLKGRRLLVGQERGDLGRRVETTHPGGGRRSSKSLTDRVILDIQQNNYRFGQVGKHLVK